MFRVQHQVVELSLGANTCVANLVSNPVGLHLEARTMEKAPETTFSVTAFNDLFVHIKCSSKFFHRRQFIFLLRRHFVMLLLLNNAINYLDESVHQTIFILTFGQPDRVEAPLGLLDDLITLSNFRVNSQSPVAFSKQLHLLGTVQHLFAILRYILAIKAR